MAHTFHKIYGTLEIDVCHLYGNFAVGAAGAPTLPSTGAKGVASVTRNSAGKYTIVLDDNYNAVLWADVKVLHNNADNPTTAGIVSRLVSMDAQAVGGGVVVVQFLSVTDGSAIDVANGSTVYFKIDVRRSSVT